MSQAGRSWTRWLGLRRREGRWLRYVPNRWGLAYLAVAFVGVNLAMMEYTKTPGFCSTCHSMDPYFEAWHDSSHAQVKCVKCHVAPGLAGEIKAKRASVVKVAKTLAGYPVHNPRSQVEDATCLRSGCHVEDELRSASDWTVQAAAGNEVTIRFDHQPHLEGESYGKQLRCASCHGQIEVGTHMAVTLDNCFLCHLKNVPREPEQAMATCTTCHDSPSEAVRLPTGDFLHATYIDRGVGCENCHSNVIGGRGEVSRQQCWSCHNRREDVARFDDVEFIHQSHVSDRKVECLTCHERIVHRLDAPQLSDGVGPFNTAHALEQSGECGSCHNQMHAAALAIYSGTGGVGVPEMPSPMYRAQVDCIACHRPAAPAEDRLPMASLDLTQRATQAACEHCHHDEYPGRLEEWREAIRQRLGEARQALAEAEAALGRIPEPRVAEARAWLADARHNLWLVEAGPGVHNVHYASALLSVTIDRSRQVIAEAAEPAPPPVEP